MINIFSRRSRLSIIMSLGSLFLLLVAAVPALAMAQAAPEIPFIQLVVDGTAPTDPHNKAVADINGDGFTDLLAAGASANDGLFWYAYPNWTKHQIAPGDFTTDMQAADIDGDGDVDAVIPNSAGLQWYENPGPSGDPAVDAWTVHLIGSSGANNHDVEVADVDVDGDLDVVSRRKGGTGTFFWEQVSPTSWNQITIDAAHGEGVGLGDIDGDGDIDVAQNGFWSEQVTPTSWTAHVFDTNWPDDVGVLVADVDVNGTLDIVIGPSESANGRLSWYETLDPVNGPWTEHVIDSSVSYLHTFKVADIDLDGTLDVVTAEMHQSDDPDEVSVYRNVVGDGSTWQQQVLAVSGSHNIRIADIGNDGDLDIFGANWSSSAPNGAPLELWENTLNDPLPLNQWVRHEIDSSKPWRSIFIDSADIDGDALQDIVTGGWWYKNPGNAAGTWVRTAIGSPLNNLASLHDFDGDGDADILGTQGEGSTSNSSFAWAENDGLGGFTVRTNIENAAGDFLQGAVTTPLQGALKTVLSWHNGGTGVQALTVPNDPVNQTWIHEVLSTTSQDEDVSVGDIDNDSDSDLLLGTQWLRNDPPAWNPFVLNGTAAAPDRNHLIDMNGDGRLDAVVGFEGISSLAPVVWYEQPLSSTDPWIEHIISTTTIGPMSLDVADMDRDGDFDVVVGEHNLVDPSAARLLIFENLDGVGTNWGEVVASTGDEHHDGAQVVDIDNDGDLDILSIGWGHSNVLLYENTAIAPISSDPPLPTLFDDAFAHWALDEGVGTVAGDSSGNGFDGTLVNGVSWALGQVGGSALDFDGVDDFVDLGTLDVSGSALSLSAWVRSDNLGNCSSNNDCRIISKATGTSTADHFWMVSTIRDGSQTKLRFRLKTNGTTTTLIAPSSSVSNNTWTHVAATYDGSMMRLYQDGVEVGSAAKSGAVSGDATVPVNIGRNPDGYGEWDGTLDDVRLYDRALTLAEVEELAGM